jgi:hypothetical protein
MARAGETPPAFRAARERHAAAEAAVVKARKELHGLLIEADEVGVKPAALARWSGYTARRVFQITREGY